MFLRQLTQQASCINASSLSYTNINMKMLSAKWLRHELTMNQKRIRMNISINVLNKFHKNSMDLLYRFINLDETCVHYYTSKIKWKLKQYISPGKSLWFHYCCMTRQKICYALSQNMKSIFIILFPKKLQTKTLKFLSL